MCDQVIFLNQNSNKMGQSGGGDEVNHSVNCNGLATVITVDAFVDIRRGHTNFLNLKDAMMRLRFSLSLSLSLS